MQFGGVPRLELTRLLVLGIVSLPLSLPMVTIVILPQFGTVLPIGRAGLRGIGIGLRRGREGRTIQDRPPSRKRVNDGQLTPRTAGLMGIIDGGGVGSRRAEMGGSTVEGKVTRTRE